NEGSPTHWWASWCSLDIPRNPVPDGSHPAAVCHTPSSKRGYRSRICQFISCSAENFKKDPTFGNLQLAAQVLSDRKLRQTISRSAIDAVCKEQGMDDGQCKLFSNGFQLIDKYPLSFPKILMDDAEYVVEPAPGRAKVFGSKTWSSQPDQGGNIKRVIYLYFCQFFFLQQVV
ncbi:unnamed protein product, partial [Heligmosomoides polygyrus]|uniref:STPPase_N domain-containing protein n=1 Tax=Heligmosomoides polygyrus TaxID=6339 RepID=A0A183F4R7_HELPZ